VFSVYGFRIYGFRIQSSGCTGDVSSTPGVETVGVVEAGGDAVAGAAGVGVVVTAAAPDADTSTPSIWKSLASKMRFLAAKNTDTALSCETVTVVSTSRVEARSRRRVKCSVTDAMATVEDATETASATPFTYASRSDEPKSAIDMARVTVNVTADVQSEHASQGPPSIPVNPAEQ
jgi:hypothetical protein